MTDVRKQRERQRECRRSVGLRKQVRMDMGREFIDIKPLRSLLRATVNQE